MKKSLITLIILVGLTILTAIISNVGGSYASYGILSLGAIKFLGVSFYFMEMKKANIFWKVTISLFLVIFMVVTMVLLV